MHPRKPLLAVSDYAISPKMRKDFCIEAHWLCTRIHPLYDKSFFALASGARTRHPKFNVFDAPAPGTNPAPRARASPLPLLPEEPALCTHLAPEGTLLAELCADAGGFGAGLHSRKLRRREGQVRRCAGGGSLGSGGGTGARAGDGGA